MLEEYYKDEFVTIYFGDSTDSLGIFGVDAIVTDPPYGINEATNRLSRGRSALAQCNDFAPVYGDDKPFDPSQLLALNVPTVLFGANNYCDKLPPASHWIVWDKLNGLKTTKRAVGFNDNADVELAWTNLPGPARLFSHRWMGAMKDSERRDRRVHPTQKPIALMEWVLLQTPGELILDPYMGAGSTLIAAKKAGRKAIGIEIVEDYCAVAAKRCQEI